MAFITHTRVLYSLSSQVSRVTVTNVMSPLGIEPDLPRARQVRYTAPRLLMITHHT